MRFMYFLARVMLQWAFLLAAYGLAVMAWLTWPYSGVAMLPIGMAIRRHLRSRRLTACGTSRFADEDDLCRAKMLNAKSGIILGKVRLPNGPGRYWRAVWDVLCGRGSAEEVCRRFVEARRAGWRKNGTEAVVRLPQSAHNAVIFAPVGAGKSTGIFLPWLLSEGNDESAIVIDFKGELSVNSALARAKKMGHEIVILDPYKVVTKLPFPTATLNPLDAIDKDDPEAVDYCRDLAEAIVIRTGEEKDPHWPDSGEAVIATAIGVVVNYGPPGKRSLQEVVAIINHPDRFDHMRKIAVESDAWGGALSNMGGQLLHLQGEEKSSVLSTASRFLRFLNTPAVMANTRTSSFDVSAIRDRKMTVYLVLPPEHLRAQSGLLRLWITSLLHAAVKGGLQDE